MIFKNISLKQDVRFFVSFWKHSRNNAYGFEFLDVQETTRVFYVLMSEVSLNSTFR